MVFRHFHIVIVAISDSASLPFSGFAGIRYQLLHTFCYGAV